MTELRDPPRNKSTTVAAQVDCTHRESHDSYALVIVQLQERWRIIICRDHVQWILQKKEASHAGPWRADSYHVTRDTLIKVCGRLGLLSDANTKAYLLNLPDRFIRDRS